jgi:peroxiredoxin
MAVSSSICEFGWRAPDFALPGVDGKTYRLEDVRGPKGTVIIFMCNHCPYVIAVIERLVRDAIELQEMGIGVAAICSNDAGTYPDDSFENMKLFAERHRLPFPYLHDESQEVARAYDAQCTPDFFGFDYELGLRYRGRLDEGRRDPPPEGARRELVEAMRQVVATGEGPADQVASMGCSIKWKQAA